MRDERLSEDEQMIFTNHLQTLCDANGLRLRIIEECVVGAYPLERLVHMIPVVFIEDYCIGLHEIGHCVLRHDPSQRREWKEILAWKWAVKNSLFWDRQMEEHRVWCLQCWGIVDDDPAKYL